MATDIVYTTTVLPPAFIGEYYEGSISIKSNATIVSAQSISAGYLPEGLAFDTALGSLRIAGTPTGAANATPQSGVGTYSFTVSAADSTDTAVTKALSIRLYASRRDPAFLADESVAGEVADLNLA